MTNDQGNLQQRVRRARWWLVTAGLAIVLVACVLAMVGLNLSHQSPTWWRSTRAEDPRTIAAGEQLETGVVNLMYGERPREPWSVNLHAADANAWLNTRLSQWLANADETLAWPEEFEDVQVEFDEGLIHLGLRVGGADGSRIYTITLRPRIDESGSLWLTAQWVHVGRLPIPADWVLRGGDGPAEDILPRRVREHPELVALLEAMAGRRALREEPVLELADGRRVRLLRLASTDGRLHVQCQTELE